MMPDVKKDEKKGWLVLMGAIVVCLTTFFMFSDGGALETQAESAQSKLSTGGREDMAKHVQRQMEANQKLRETIEQLKIDTRFELAEYYQIPPNTPQPGFLFKKKFIEVRERLRNKAAARRIVYDENIGFGSDPKVPDDREAPYLMTMLQVTEKLVSIAIETPAPLETFSVVQLTAIDTGPVSRPVLVREYPLTLKVRGGLKDILWMLHRISEVSQTSSGVKTDYPLILTGFSIKSENATPKDDISQLDAEFQIAAMRFISEEERAKDPLAFQGVGGGSRTTSSSGGKGVYYARP
jgi:hypothetical protein